MAIVTYKNLDFGFGVTYDDARLVCIPDPSEPRLEAAWTTRIPSRIAAAVLFTTTSATATTVAHGLTPSLLMTTDGLPLPPLLLAQWDWDDVAPPYARLFLETTGAAAVDAVGMYWRGFPVLQYTTVPATADSPAPVECLSIMHTPAQTFAIELVLPLADADVWSARLQEVADGFFLLPIEREGKMRTGHHHVWSQRIEAAQAKDMRPR